MSPSVTTSLALSKKKCSEFTFFSFFPDFSRENDNFVRFLEGNYGGRSVFPSENAFSTLENHALTEEVRVESKTSFQDILESKLSENSVFHSRTPSAPSSQGLEPLHLSSLFALRPSKISVNTQSKTPKAYQKSTGPLSQTAHNKKLMTDQVQKSKEIPKPIKVRTPGPKHKLTAVQQSSVSFFVSHQAVLPEDFHRDELKLAYRLLALKLHPDRQEGSAIEFIELKSHYEILKKLFV